MSPTPKQLAYLRTLAQQTGETFTYPSTRAEASAEIDRLLRRPKSTRAERVTDAREVKDGLTTRADDATRVRDHEVTGHGSQARWSGDEPKRSERELPKVGERKELARYHACGQERVIYGQRVNGVVRVFDKPITGAGRSYLIEREVASKDELDALVFDYVTESEHYDKPAVLIHLDDLHAANELESRDA